MVARPAWIAFFACACAAKPQPPASQVAPPPAAVASSGASAPPPAGTEVELPGAPLLLATDPDLMRALEAEGLALGAFFGIAGAPSTRALMPSPRYADVVSTLRADVAELGRGDPAAGVGVQRFTHRLFDVRWLDADTTRFELVGVVNRPDRAVFTPGSCGETRLIYRLAYRVERRADVAASRLPMTLSLELPQAPGGATCAELGARFRTPVGLDSVKLARFLRGPRGALADVELGRGFSAHRLAVNLQGVRWPSMVRPDLGGHAEYLLRSFALEGERYRAATLENTPDRERLARDPELKAELVSWIREPANLAAIDRGTALLPERFLARRISSVAPRGLSRVSNRPFASVLTERELGELELSSLPALKSTASVIRRLDALSCPGCHAARSLAGFHLLGADPADALAENALAHAVSAHLSSDQRRRERLLVARLSGEPEDPRQPFPERGEYDGFGAHCGLGSDPSFAGWTCGAGLTCRAFDAPAGDGVGTCLPEAPGTAGDACEAGPLSTRVNAKRDRVARVERSACTGSAVCNGNAVGFPGGMCTESCSELSDTAACGRIALLDPFNACLARGEAFERCLSAHTSPAGLRTCSIDQPCRDDYVCARGAGTPVCIPPYFLFQLRVDGHP